MGPELVAFSADALSYKSTLIHPTLNGLPEEVAVVAVYCRHPAVHHRSGGSLDV